MRSCALRPCQQVGGADRKDGPSRSDPHDMRARVRAVLEARAKQSLAEHKQDPESAAAESAVLRALQAGGSASESDHAGVFFGTVEDFQGLERGLVLVAGFQDPLYVKARLGALAGNHYHKARAEV